MNSPTAVLTMSSDYSGKGLVLDAGSIASFFRKEIKESLVVCTRPPKLVGILATSSPPSKFYAEFTRKQCAQLGIDFALKTTGAGENEELPVGEGVEEAIIEANEDGSVDGIMVRSPRLHGGILASLI